jgi:S1-C subfamily serine protease
MGNSGGALISTDGKLIGINSAIASPTGYYSGYSYAIPVNIVKKVIDDLIKFGTVQRGFLGVRYVNASDMSDDEKGKQGIPVTSEGIYVTDVPKDGGAYEAGIRKGDIIKKLNGAEIINGGEMQGVISRQKPGDKLPVTYIRNGKETTALVTLKNKAGNYDIVKADAVLETLGAELASLDPKKAKEYGVAGGVIVKKINEGALNDQTRMKDGFIILKVNDKEVKSVDEMKAAVGANKSITISGFYPGYDGVYEYPISLDGN